MSEDFVAHRIGPPPKTLRKLSRNEELAVGQAAEIAWRVREGPSRSASSKTPVISIPIVTAVKKPERSHSGTSFSSVILNNPPPSPCSAVPKPTPRSASGLSLPSDVYLFGEFIDQNIQQPNQPVGIQSVYHNPNTLRRDVGVSLFSEQRDNIITGDHLIEHQPPSPDDNCDAVEVLPSPDISRRQYPLRDRLAESKSALIAALLEPSGDSHRVDMIKSTNKRCESQGTDSQHELEQQLAKSQQKLNEALEDEERKEGNKQRKSLPTRSNIKGASNTVVDPPSHISSPSSPYELECKLSQSRKALSLTMDRAQNQPPSSLQPQSRVTSSILTLSSALSSLKANPDSVFTVPRSSASMLEEELKRVQQQEDDTSDNKTWEAVTTWEEVKAIQQTDKQKSMPPKEVFIQRRSASTGRGRRRSHRVQNPSSAPQHCVAPPNSETSNIADTRNTVVGVHINQKGSSTPPAVNNVRSYTSASWGRSVTEMTSNPPSVSWTKPTGDSRRVFGNLDVNLIDGKRQYGDEAKVPPSMTSPASRVLEEKLAVAQKRLRSQTYNMSASHVTCWY